MSTPSGSTLSAPDQHDLVASSIQLILDLQDPSGAYPASPTFSAYRGYSWFRDGSFIADGMSAAGQFGSAERFFSWCARAVESHAQPIEQAWTTVQAGGEPDTATLPPTRFTLAGELGTDGWWDFQTDGYGTWLWAISEHVRRGGSFDEWWLGAINLTVKFLVSTRGVPCFDWWEEHQDKFHVSTLGCVVVGLERALAHGWVDEALRAGASTTIAELRARILSEGVVDGHLTKWLGSNAVDGSLAAVVYMGLLDDAPELADATLAAVRKGLLVENGVYRFLADVFFGGGRWPLLTCFLTLAELRRGDDSAASERLAWVASTANAAQEMPEQVEGHLLAPEHRQEWLDRWGPVAQPLLWTHAMYIRLNAEERSR